MEFTFLVILGEFAHFEPKCRNSNRCSGISIVSGVILGEKVEVYVILAFLVILAIFIIFVNPWNPHFFVKNRVSATLSVECGAPSSPPLATH